MMPGYGVSPAVTTCTESGIALYIIPKKHRICVYKKLENDVNGYTCAALLLYQRTAEARVKITVMIQKKPQETKA